MTTLLGRRDRSLRSPLGSLLSDHRFAITASATTVAAGLAGLLVVAVTEDIGPLASPALAPITSLPLAVYPMAAAALLTAVLIRNHWWLGLALFFAWLPFEDLVRKFADNDLRVYFVKDAVLAVAMIGALPYLRGQWRSVLGSAWLPTVALFTFATVMSLPAASHAISLPVVAFHTRFLFALLLPVGAYIARDAKRVEKALFGLALLTGVICLLGIIQAVIGPTFLNPSLNTSTLSHLTVQKQSGNLVVLRPSATFADVSRFAYLTIIAVVVALSSARAATSPVTRRVSYLLVAVGLVGAFASASRAAFLASLFILAVSLKLPGAAGLRTRLTTIFVVAAVVVLGASVGGRARDAYRATSTFLSVTVNPWSHNFEIAERMTTYGQAIVDGVTGAGFLGSGTGTESLGKQYIDTNFDGTATESGWGSIGAELGLAGLAVWVVWTVAWVRRAFERPRNEPRDGIADARFIIAVYLAVYLIALFSLGLGVFENYVANAFFWFLSGVAFVNRAGAHPRRGGERSTTVELRPISLATTQ